MIQYRHSAELTNVSTRGFVGTGDNVLIAGFIASGGNGRTQSWFAVLDLPRATAFLRLRHSGRPVGDSAGQQRKCRPDQQ